MLTSVVKLRVKKNKIQQNRYCTDGLLSYIQFSNSFFFKLLLFGHRGWLEILLHPKFNNNFSGRYKNLGRLVVPVKKKKKRSSRHVEKRNLSKIFVSSLKTTKKISLTHDEYRDDGVIIKSLEKKKK